MFQVALFVDSFYSACRCLVSIIVVASVGRCKRCVVLICLSVYWCS